MMIQNNQGRKTTFFVFGAMMSATMAGTISFFVALVNFGIKPDFFVTWLHIFSLSFPIAFPAAILISPIIMKMANKITRQKLRTFKHLFEKPPEIVK